MLSGFSQNPSLLLPPLSWNINFEKLGQGRRRRKLQKRRKEKEPGFL
jgi:hypothetical protein